MWIYVFYLFTLSIPTLIFVLGCALSISAMVKNRPLSVLVLGLFGLGVYFYLDEWQFGAFALLGQEFAEYVFGRGRTP